MRTTKEPHDEAAKPHYQGHRIHRMGGEKVAVGIVLLVLPVFFWLVLLKPLVEVREKAVVAHFLRVRKGGGRLGKVNGRRLRCLVIAKYCARVVLVGLVPMGGCGSTSGDSNSSGNRSSRWQW